MHYRIQPSSIVTNVLADYGVERDMFAQVTLPNKNFSIRETLCYLLNLPESTRAEYFDIVIGLQSVNVEDMEVIYTVNGNKFLEVNKSSIGALYRDVVMEAIDKQLSIEEALKHHGLNYTAAQFQNYAAEFHIVKCVKCHKWSIHKDAIANSNSFEESNEQIVTHICTNCW